MDGDMGELGFLDADGRKIRVGDTIVHVNYPTTYYTVISYCERTRKMKVSWGKRVIRTGNLKSLQAKYYKVAERKKREFEWMEVWSA